MSGTLFILHLLKLTWFLRDCLCQNALSHTKHLKDLLFPHSYFWWLYSEVLYLYVLPQFGQTMACSGKKPPLLWRPSKCVRGRQLFTTNQAFLKVKIPRPKKLYWNFLCTKKLWRFKLYFRLKDNWQIVQWWTTFLPQSWCKCTLRVGKFL